MHGAFRNTRTSSSAKGQRYSPYGASQPPPVPPQPTYDPVLAQYYAQIAAMQSMQGANPYMQISNVPEAKIDFIKVAQSSIPKSVAGKIAADARSESLTPVQARGPAAVNIATKAVAMACSFLAAEGISLSVSPYHLNDGDNQTGRTVVFHLRKSAAPKAIPTTTLKVTKTSNVSKVGGSIAAKIRQGEVIAMQGIGPDSVSHAVDSFVVARRFLKADGSKMDIVFTPHFVTVEHPSPVPGSKKSSALHFSITAVARK